MRENITVNPVSSPGPGRQGYWLRGSNSAIVLVACAVMMSGCALGPFSNYAAFLSSFDDPTAGGPGVVDVSLHETATPAQIRKIRTFLKAQPGAGPIRYIGASRVLKEKCGSQPMEITISEPPQPTPPSPCNRLEVRVQDVDTYALSSMPGVESVEGPAN